MDQIGIELILPIIVALIASIPGALSFYRLMRRDNVELKNIANKSEVESSDVLAGIALSLVDPLKEKVASLEERDRVREEQFNQISVRLALVERNNAVLCHMVRRLIAQVKSFGAVPVVELDESLCEEMKNGSEVELDRLT